MQRRAVPSLTGPERGGEEVEFDESPCSAVGRVSGLRSRKGAAAKAVPSEGWSPVSVVRPSSATSVGKALLLLEAFDGFAASIGVTELARRAEIPKSTAYRLLNVLAVCGYVERDDDRYRLSRKLFEMGNLVAYCWPSSLRDVAMPYLGDLYARTKETVHLAVSDDGDVVYLEKLYGHHTVNSPSRIGARVPLHCTGLGKAMLAFASSDDFLSPREFTRFTPTTIASEEDLRAELGRIAHDGIAFDREESRQGVACVAAPVLLSGRAIAAVSVCGPTERFRPERAAELVNDTVREMTRELSLAGVVF